MNCSCPKCKDKPIAPSLGTTMFVVFVMTLFFITVIL